MGFFSDVGDFFLGSDDKAKTKAAPVFTPEQISILQELESFFTGTGSPSQVASGAPSGDVVAPLTGLEETSLAGLEARALQLATGGDPLTQTAQTALTDLLTKGPADFEDFFNEAVFKPAKDQLFEETIPLIGKQFGDQLFSGERRKAVSDATGDFFDSLNRERSSLAFQTELADRESILAAAGLVPQVTGATTNELTTLLEAGGVPREVETARRTAQFDNFLRLRELENLRAQVAGIALGRPGQENITTVTEGQAGLIPSFLGSAVGVAGEAAGKKIAAAIL